MSLMIDKQARRAFDCFLAISGEPVTLGSATFLAQVNRNLEEASSGGGALQPIGDEISVFLVPLTSQNLTENSVIKDRFGFSHRIKKVSHVGHAYRLACQVIRN